MLQHCYFGLAFVDAFSPEGVSRCGSSGRCRSRRPDVGCFLSALAAGAEMMSIPEAIL